MVAIKYEVPDFHANIPSTPPPQRPWDPVSALEDYAKQLYSIPHCNKRGLLRARREQEESQKHKELLEYQLKLEQLEAQNKKRLMSARVESSGEVMGQDQTFAPVQPTYLANPTQFGHQNASSPQANEAPAQEEQLKSNDHRSALQDYQMQKMLLEAQYGKKIQMPLRGSFQQSDEVPAQQEQVRPNDHSDGRLMSAWQMTQMVMRNQLRMKCPPQQGDEVPAQEQQVTPNDYSSAERELRMRGMRAMRQAVALSGGAFYNGMTPAQIMQTVQERKRQGNIQPAIKGPSQEGDRAVREYQRQIQLAMGCPSQQAEEAPAQEEQVMPNDHSSALREYQMQKMLLQEQLKKRAQIAMKGPSQQADEPPAQDAQVWPNSQLDALREYRMHKMMLEIQNKQRVKAAVRAKEKKANMAKILEEEAHNYWVRDCRMAVAADHRALPLHLKQDRPDNLQVEDNIRAEQDIAQAEQQHGEGKDLDTGCFGTIDD